MASHPQRSAAALAVAALLAAGCGTHASPTSADAGGDAPPQGAADTTASSEQSDPSATAGTDAGSEVASDEAGWCATDALSASLDAMSPAAGNRYAALVLTNTSDTACRTQGWPGLQLATPDGDELPTTTVRDRSEHADPLTLQPGESVWSRLHWSVVPGEGDPATGCGPEQASLRVIPPDERSAIRAAWELGEVCGDGRIEALPLASGDGPG
ncbi:DUF4232 domain-containing protein [Streptomyces sp. B6B3]|uniref:DUF4232 domain-containing protein n=1 Tax=Streptomyces sp. B6B3 TaxID=3153570 RepID=UPI00325DC645